jgi:uncharacterized protein (DUF924 family)
LSLSEPHLGVALGAKLAVFGALGEACAMTGARTVSPSDVLEYWFGAPGEPPLAKAENWWKKDAAFDADLRRRFGDALELAKSSDFDSWRTSPRGRLALVILLDQVSRNIFRGTARAFAQDPLARDIATQALEAGDDQTLTPTEAGFLFMPLMHAEELALQQRCHEGFRGLTARVEPNDPVRTMLENNVKYAKMHMDVVARFGRFPHRNVMLERASTHEEEAFLKEPGSSF